METGSLKEAFVGFNVVGGRVIKGRQEDAIMVAKRVSDMCKTGTAGVLGVHQRSDGVVVNEGAINGVTGCAGVGAVRATMSGGVEKVFWHAGDGCCGTCVGASG